MDIRGFTSQIALSYLGRPYIWGGDDPILGFDCSGFWIELHQSVGVLPRQWDGRAQDIYARFKHKAVSEPREGCSVLYGESVDRITHIEYCLGRRLSIGASGGSSRTATQADAIRDNAYIKIRPFRSRGGIVAFIDPFLGFTPEEGV